MKRFVMFVICASMSVAVCLSATATEKMLALEKITQAWKQGQTLPESIFSTHAIPAGKPGGNDTGINVLIDLSRRCNFAWLWTHPSHFHRNGFRTCGTQATLDTVIGQHPRCRVRVKTPDAEPFAWWRPPAFNVVIVQAGSPHQQQFLPEEIVALKAFVEQGGGVIIISETPKNEEIAKAWSFNRLLAAFGAAVLPKSEQTPFGRATLLEVGREWKVLEQGEQGGVVRASRHLGKGRILIVEDTKVLCPAKRGKNKKEGSDALQEVLDPLDEEETLKRQKELVLWVAGGKPPVGGEGILPQPRAGGGGIYPDQETRVDGMVAYYAKNQIPDLLKVVREDLPKTTEYIYRWLPSVKPEEPIMFILSAGSGGGWAVNVRLPKEVGIISDSRMGIIGIFAHEQAHTMRGPQNAKGGYGAMPAHDLSGEAHAGWFQGKAWAMFDDEQKKVANRNCNSILKDKALFLEFDFAKHYQKPDTTFDKGFGWIKLWWVWQKLDDRYGPTWYPRWYWVRATRWADSSKRQTWDETIEDMSIAVGEDLFPFFKKIGTTLNKERFEKTTFEGRTLTLPVAPLDLEPGGPVNLSPIGDYTKPLKR
jgi:hypothetical protein